MEKITRDHITDLKEVKIKVVTITGHKVVITTIIIEIIVRVVTTIVAKADITEIADKVVTTTGRKVVITTIIIEITVKAVTTVTDLITTIEQVVSNKEDLKTTDLTTIVAR